VVKAPFSLTQTVGLLGRGLATRELLDKTGRLADGQSAIRQLANLRDAGRRLSGWPEAR